MDMAGCAQSHTKGTSVGDPPLLADKGLAEALAAQARKSPVPAAVKSDDVGRYPQEVEAAVYFCCLEALQNAAEHAGTNATATIRLWQEKYGLLFEVSDDGAGFDAATPRGAGLTNMCDRLSALGGRLTISSEPGRGTRVLGTIPLVP